MNILATTYYFFNIQHPFLALISYFINIHIQKNTFCVVVFILVCYINVLPVIKVKSFVKNSILQVFVHILILK